MILVRFFKFQYLQYKFTQNLFSKQPNCSALRQSLKLELASQDAKAALNASCVLAGLRNNDNLLVSFKLIRV